MIVSNENETLFNLYYCLQRNMVQEVFKEIFEKQLEKFLTRKIKLLILKAK